VTFIEFLGFIISLAAMIVLFLRKVFEERRRAKNPEEYHREQDEKERRLREFLSGLQDDMHKTKDFRKVREDEEEEDEEDEWKEKKYIPPVVPTPPKQVFKPKYEYKAEKLSQTKQSEHYYLHRSHDAYDLAEMDVNPSRASEVVSRLGSKKDMVILHELLSPPKSLRR